MKVALGRRGDYAVRAVLDLARHYGVQRRKTREIAAEMDIPQGFLQQILAGLVQSHVVSARAGPAGGYALALPPERITLLQVVEGAEGPMTLTSCVLRGGDCDRAKPCVFHDHWADAQEVFARRLADVTFGDLLTGP